MSSSLFCAVLLVADCWLAVQSESAQSDVGGIRGLGFGDDGFFVVSHKGAFGFSSAFYAVELEAETEFERRKTDGQFATIVCNHLGEAIAYYGMSGPVEAELRHWCVQPCLDCFGVAVDRVLAESIDGAVDAVGARSMDGTASRGSEGLTEPALEAQEVWLRGHERVHLDTANIFSEEEHAIRIRMLPVFRDSSAQPHLDAYGEGGDVRSVPLQLREHLMEVFNFHLLVKSERASEVSRKHRFGEFPAFHCQGISLLSIAEDIKSGRFVHRLLSLMQTVAKDWPWTQNGLNIGAGEGDVDDDPLREWEIHLGKAVVLIDASHDRLTSASARTVLGASDSVDNVRTDSMSLRAIVHTAAPQDLRSNGTLISQIREHVGDRVDVLKIDVDSYDCELLGAVLESVSASVIVLESISFIPPPIRFARLYHPKVMDHNGWIGCSLSYQLHLLHPRYVLLLYTEQDTVFVEAGLVPHLEVLPAGSLFTWTTFKPRFPIDEIDCFRRSRIATEGFRPSGAEETLPISFLREWLNDPASALAPLWDNITSALVGAPFLAPFSLFL